MNSLVPRVLEIHGFKVAEAILAHYIWFAHERPHINIHLYEWEFCLCNNKLHLFICILLVGFSFLHHSGLRCTRSTVLVLWWSRSSRATRRLSASQSCSCVSTSTTTLSRTASSPHKMLGLPSRRETSSGCWTRRIASGGRWVITDTY